MKKIIIFLLLIYVFIFSTCCSYRYLNKPFREFNAAADLIGKNTIYAFEQLQEEEILLRISEAVKKEEIKPSDLELRVLTAAHLETRKELIKYIVNYTELLESIVIKDYRRDIEKNSKKVNDNLENISVTHDNFLSRKEIGIISSLSFAIPEALTSIKNRDFIFKLMKQHDPLL